MTIDELLIEVGIGLGDTDIAACTAGDRNADGAISIDEILTAVGYALHGCP